MTESAHSFFKMTTSAILFVLIVITLSKVDVSEGKPDPLLIHKEPKAMEDHHVKALANIMARK